MEIGRRSLLFQLVVDAWGSSSFLGKNCSSISNVIVLVVVASLLLSKLLVLFL